MENNLFRELNSLGVLALVGVLGFAQFAQFFDHELPCPLCLLQRVGFVAVMFGLLLNVFYGCRALHYSISTVGALFGGAVALRQVSLHVIPGTPFYGSDFFGFHFYTWAFICFAMIIFGLAVISCFSRQYKIDAEFINFSSQSSLGKLAIGLGLLIVLVNAVTTFVQCGPLVCDDNPTFYWLLQ